MGITKIEHLVDRVKIQYHLQKPYGVQDEGGTREILYENINQIHSLPTEFAESRIPVNREIAKVHIEKPKSTIAFVFEKYSEKSAGPAEEDLIGVFLIEIEEDIKKSKVKQSGIELIVVLDGTMNVNGTLTNKLNTNKHTFPNRQGAINYLRQQDGEFELINLEKPEDSYRREKMYVRKIRKRIV